jgi:AcrR family transcriptional regulator
VISFRAAQSFQEFRNIALQQMSCTSDCDYLKGEAVRGVYHRKAQELRQEIILDVAGTLLARDGCEGLSANQLAQEVGIGKGTLYLHFPKQDDWIETALAKAGEDLLRALENPVGNTPEARLTSAVSLIIERFRDFPTGRLAAPCCFKNAPCPYQSWRKIEDRLQALVDDWFRSNSGERHSDSGFAARTLQHLLVAASLSRTSDPSEYDRALASVSRGYLALLGIPFNAPL